MVAARSLHKSVLPPGVVPREGHKRRMGPGTLVEIAPGAAGVAGALAAGMDVAVFG